jgi:hypothetical protein
MVAACAGDADFAEAETTESAATAFDSWASVSTLVTLGATAVEPIVLAAVVEMGTGAGAAGGASLDFGFLTGVAATSVSGAVTSGSGTVTSGTVVSGTVVSGSAEGCGVDGEVPDEPVFVCALTTPLATVPEVGLEVAGLSPVAFGVAVGSVGAAGVEGCGAC